MDEENIIYMKKGLVGWKQTDDQVEATHQLITIKEYRELTHQIKMLNKELDAVSEAIEEEIRKVSIDYSRQVREIENELEDYKVKANQEIKAAKEEIQKYKSLNENLLRISKERANADRKLKPKKEHSGYIVVSSQEKEIKYSKSKKTIIWETCIQTPYSVEFNESNVRTQINEKELWMLKSIGINCIHYCDYERINMMSEEEKQTLNIVFSLKLRANYKAGYWECIIMHTKPLKEIPKTMLQYK